MTRITGARVAICLALLSIFCKPEAKADFQIDAKFVGGSTIPLTKTNWDQHTESLAGSNPFQVVQFNPTAYGITAPPGQVAVLTAVAFELHYTFKNTITMTFQNVSTITVNASGEMHLALGSNPDIVGHPVFLNSATVTSNKGDTFPETIVSGPKIVDRISSYGYRDPTVVSQFDGTGTVSMPVIAKATSDFTSTSGNGSGTSDTLAGASLRVLYWYTFVVPEPSSMALVGIGVFGVALAGNRAQRRQKT